MNRWLEEDVHDVCRELDAGRMWCCNRRVPRPTTAWSSTTTARRTPSAATKRPRRWCAGASRRLAANIVGADVGKTFGTDDAHVPYPDTYWPFTDEGVDATGTAATRPSRNT